MSLKLLATAEASIKRAQIVGGKRAEPVVVLTELACTPLYPADAKQVNDLLQRLKLETPFRMLETFVSGNHDIRGGDTLVMNGREYPIRAVANWSPGRMSRAFTHLTVEDIPA
jgi:hypothetical protein